jgi:hypothetical protein
MLPSMPGPYTLMIKPDFPHVLSRLTSHLAADVGVAVHAGGPAVLGR